MSEIHKTHYNSAIGPLEITGTPTAVISLHFLETPSESTTMPHEFLRHCIGQLEEYFSGQRTQFSIPVQLEGTDFQKKVWRALMRIPYGTTRSYREIAQEIGDINAVRAVGNANGKNKIPIIIPCHRVIASDGKLGGFSCGLWRKTWLLEHEKIHT